MDTNTTRNLIAEREVCRRIGGEETPIHRSTLWRGIKAGRFPKPIKPTPGLNRWIPEEIDECLNKAAASREVA